MVFFSEVKHFNGAREYARNDLITHPAVCLQEHHNEFLLQRKDLGQEIAR